MLLLVMLLIRNLFLVLVIKLSGELCLILLVSIFFLEVLGLVDLLPVERIAHRHLLVALVCSMVHLAVSG